MDIGLHRSVIAAMPDKPEHTKPAELADPAIDPHAPGCLDLDARPLSGLQPMQVAVIERVDGDDEQADRLKSLGLCVGRKLQVVKLGDPLILRVLGSRLGLSRRLADRVYAQPCMLSEPPASAGTRGTASARK